MRLTNKIGALTLTALFAAGAPASAEIVLGGVFSLSGTNATPGLDQSRGVELALKTINEAGGVLGQPLRVLIEDSGGKPQTAVDAAKKLVSVDKVPLVIGEYSSGVTLPLGQYLVQEGIPHINPASTSGPVRHIGATSFSTVGLDNVSTGFAAEDVVEKGWKKVAVLAVNNAFGQGIAKEFAEHFTHMGGEVTTTVMFAQGQPSYRRELQQMEATQPDAYVFTAYGTDGALIMQESYEMGLQETPWYSVLITMMAKDTAPEFKKGLIGMDVGYIGANGQGYKDAYESTYGETFLTGYGAYAHDAVIYAAKAIERAGTTDREPLLKALKEVGEEGFEGVTGLIKHDADRQRTEQPYLKYKVEGDALLIAE